MVQLRDVVKRHAGYLGMHMVVACHGENALVCMAALALIVVCLQRSTKTTVYFYAIAGAWMTVVELLTTVLVRGSSIRGSTRPDAPLVGVPPWAPLGWAIVAQWSIDIFCVAIALGPQSQSVDHKDGKLSVV
jgi:hypothetical protein